MELNTCPAIWTDAKENTPGSTGTSKKEGEVKLFTDWHETLSYFSGSKPTRTPPQHVQFLQHMIPDWPCGCGNMQVQRHWLLGTENWGDETEESNCLSLLLGLLPVGRECSSLIKFLLLCCSLLGRKGGMGAASPSTQLELKKNIIKRCFHPPCWWCLARSRDVPPSLIGVQRVLSSSIYI